MSLQVSHYNMLRASHEVSQKVVVRTVITVRFARSGRQDLLNISDKTKLKTTIEIKPA
jgi:hypothetical protein